MMTALLIAVDQGIDEVVEAVFPELADFKGLEASQVT